MIIFKSLLEESFNLGVCTANRNKSITFYKINTTRLLIVCSEMTYMVYSFLQL